MSSESTLRKTVTVLMRLAGDDQSQLAAAIGLTQGQISRKQAGKAVWTLADCDRVARRYGITVPILLSGPNVALAAAAAALAQRPLFGD